MFRPLRFASWQPMARFGLSQLILLLMIGLVPLGHLSAQEFSNCGTFDGNPFANIPDQPLAGCTEGVPDLGTALAVTADVTVPNGATVGDITVELSI